MSKRRKTNRQILSANRRRTPHLEILENRRLLTANSDSPNVAISSINQYGTVLFGQDWQDDLGLSASQIQQHIQADTWRSALNDSSAATISQIRQEAQYLGAETLQAQIDSALASANLPTIDVREFDWLQERNVGPAVQADYFADGEILDEMLAEGEGGTERKFYIKFQEYETYEGHLINAGQDSTLTIHIGYTGDYVEGGFSVGWNATNGTASAGSDFTPASGTVNFTDTAEGEQAVNLTIINDTIDELDETFAVQVGSPDGARGSTEVTIWENDLHVAIFDADPVTEGDVYTPWVSQMPKSRFRVTISSPRDYPVSIPYKVLNGNPNDPPAFRGPDFYYWQSDNPEIDGSITFEPNETEKFIEIPIVSDYLHEPNEYFYVEIASQWLFQLAYIVDDGHARGTIVDDDPIIDLDAALVLHNQSNGWLNDSEEEDIGAFLPVNDDDDNYDVEETSSHEPDMIEIGSITGETDLLKLRLSKFKESVAGLFSFVVPAHIRLWLNPNRSSQIISLDATRDWEFYAEATSKGEGLLTVYWHKQDFSASFIADEVKLTSFQWVGPLNVPEYAIYQYTADGPLATSHWISDASGTIVSGAGTKDVEILWGQGEVVGKAAYRVNNGYTWDLEVNIVTIEVGPLNRITMRNSPVQAFNTEYIKSVADDNTEAMEAELTFTLKGPMVNGRSRGVEFIETGYTQTVVLNQIHADFDQLPKASGIGTGRRLSLAIEGNEYIDGSSSHHLPWTSSTSSVDASGVLPYLVESFWEGDTPKLPGTGAWVGNIEINGVTFRDYVDSFSLVMDFELCLSVRTKDNRNSASSIFTKRLRADWQFDGSGSIDAPAGWDLPGSGGAILPGVWTQTGQGNTVHGSQVSSFIPVTDGRRVTDNRTLAKTATDEAIWEWSDQ